MAFSVSFQNPSPSHAIKVIESRSVVDEKTRKPRYIRGNTRLVQAKGRGDESVVLWFDPGKLKYESEALPSYHALFR